MKQRFPKTLALGLMALACAGGCSGSGPDGLGPQSTVDGSPPDTVARTTPVVPGRPARVFIFAGLGDKCEPVAAPRITVTAPPAKGDVSFLPGQQTTIQYSVRGTCTGHKAVGTGVYYTARAGQSGADSFTVEARLGGGELATRTFDVKIAE